MKIANVIGICGLASALVFGCGGGGGPGFPQASESTTGATSGNAGGSTASGASSQDDDAGVAGNSGGAATSGSSSGSATSGTSTSPVSSGSSSGAAGISTSDDAGSDSGTVPIPQNNAEIDYTQTKTITMDTFVVQPNQEVFKCQDFANPWGKQVDIKTYDLDMETGSHHMFAFYKSGGTNASLIDCPSGGLTFGPFTFTSQQHEVAQTYPPTIGATIPQGTGFTMMVHYLNTTTAAINSHVVLTMAIAKPGVVTQHAGILYLDDTSLVVKPGISTSNSSYTLQQNVTIMETWSHMHQGATNFISSTSSGQTLFTTTEWAEPAAKVYSPALTLNQGTTIKWSCTYDNTTGTTRTFGESAVTNVMCISISVFYPVENTSDPVIGMP